jgi:hypothetical protein
MFIFGVQLVVGKRGVQVIQHALVSSLLSLLKPMNELFSIVVNQMLDGS